MADEPWAGAERNFTKVIRISETAYDEVTEAAEERGMRVADLASRLIRTGVAKLPEPIEGA